MRIDLLLSSNLASTNSGCKHGAAIVLPSAFPSFCLSRKLRGISVNLLLVRSQAEKLIVKFRFPRAQQRSDGEVSTHDHLIVVASTGSAPLPICSDSD